jgi:hypothetical protein
LAVADSIGDVHLLDVRKMSTGRYLGGRSSGRGEETGLGRLVGPGGSIRSMVVHPTRTNVLACVGLDRKLWTWDLASRNGKRKPMDCVYLKQRLNCVLFCDDGGYGDATDGKDDDDDDAARHDNDGTGDSGTGRIKRERDLEDDAVEDYVDSDDDDNAKGNDDMAREDDGGGGNDNGMIGSGSEDAETESGSEDKDNDDDDDDDDDESEPSDNDDASGDDRESDDDDAILTTSKRSRK